MALGDRGSDVVGMEVPAGLSVDQADDGAVSDKPGLGFRVKGGIVAVGVEPPVVVRILVVVASNLLLAGAVGVGWTRVRKAWI